MKKQAFLIAAGALLLGLAGCSSTITTTKKSYSPTGMVAVVKGNVHGVKKVSYSTDTTSGKADVNDNGFVITVPASTKKQTLTVKADGKSTTTTIKASKSMGSYQAIAKKYNQAIIGMALPKNVQAAMKKASKQKKPTKAQLAMMPAPQKLAMAKQEAAMQKALKDAQTKTKSKQLPENFDGLKQGLKTSGGTVRMNVQDGQLMSLTDIVPIKILKEKKAQKDFGTQFALLANAVGADPKKVGKKFQDAIKSNKKKSGNNTTMNTIKSNGVKFDVGYSTTNLYIYVTK